MMKINIPVILQFLENPFANNDREWFNEHRSEYEATRVKFNDSLVATVARISLFDKTIQGIQPRDCTYRIYRGTRFSVDKTSYKMHFGGYVNAKGKKSNHCGCYIHLQPDGSMPAGGNLCLPPNILRTVHQTIYDNAEEYISIVGDLEPKKYFPMVGEDFIKTAPRGFPRDFKYIDYLKCRQFVCSYFTPGDLFTRASTMERIEEVFRQFKRFADFINYTVDDFE